jgi:glutamate racemase
MSSKPIGVFDSGYGGLTILKELKAVLPHHDFLYLGDNARTPYGTRSFEVVYEFTLEAVEYLFNHGCELVILACNTASAKALRSIQQTVLPKKYPNKRVLGVIRPSSEIIGSYSISKNIGIVATEGTVKSESYLIEIQKFFPEIEVTQLACPIWVPLIENNLHQTVGGKWFIQQDIQQLLATNPQIDTILLACTHYPLVADIIQEILPNNVQLISQGKIVADSLVDYLNRHPDMNENISKNQELGFLTTENSDNFDLKASQFYGSTINSKHVRLGE